MSVAWSCAHCGLWGARGASRPRLAQRPASPRRMRCRSRSAPGRAAPGETKYAGVAGDVVAPRRVVALLWEPLVVQIAPAHGGVVLPLACAERRAGTSCASVTPSRTIQSASSTTTSSPLTRRLPTRFGGRAVCPHPLVIRRHSQGVVESTGSARTTSRPSYSRATRWSSCAVLRCTTGGLTLPPAQERGSVPGRASDGLRHGLGGGLQAAGFGAALRPSPAFRCPRASQVFCGSLRWLAARRLPPACADAAACGKDHLAAAEERQAAIIASESASARI